MDLSWGMLNNYIKIMLKYAHTVFHKIYPLYAEIPSRASETVEGKYSGAYETDMTDTHAKEYNNNI